jgi:hypothetical protein
MTDIIAELRRVALQNLSYMHLSNAAYYAQANMRLLRDAPRMERTNQSRMFLLFVAAALEGEA